jgi:hypothetical protein
MENIDILTPAPEDCPFFDVDTSAASVLIQDASVITPGSLGVVVRAGGYKYLFSKDNFTILSMGFILPEAFTMASVVPASGVLYSAFTMMLFLRNAADNSIFYIPQIGITGTQIPLENYEMPYGLYVDVSSIALANTKFRLCYDTNQILSGKTKPAISMISVPAALNGTRQRVIPFIKIQHNFTMTQSYP